MKKEDFFFSLQDVLEIDGDIVINESTNLKDTKHFEFDSIAIMTLVAFVHEKFKRKFTAVQINSITTVRSLMELIGLEHFE
jgi:acyl carrier protein